MGSLVIVSHSKKLAEGLKEILEQVARDVRIVAIGGAMASSNSDILGSDPSKIKETFLSLANDDAIFVLCDFGSTVLSVKYAIKMLPEDIAKKIYLLDAPLVEGAYAVAVQISAGSTVEEIIKSAEESRSFRKLS
ncbi:MAG: dihydroxyacetone kinase phosphoryl donor subunit DhaM [Infirmifilum sp.]